MFVGDNHTLWQRFQCEHAVACAIDGFRAAARTLADCVDQADLDQGFYPALPRIREASARIAAAVAAIAYLRGLSDGSAPNDLIGFVRSQMYDPYY